jgi:hypothetical protein
MKFILKSREHVSALKAASHEQPRPLSPCIQPPRPNMAASPSPALTEKDALLSSWLRKLLPIPPADEDFRSLKRKRESLGREVVHQLPAMSAYRSSSPGKRQRQNSEDLLPEQSASTVGSTNHALAFNNPIFSLPSSSRAGASTPRRSTSPSRETIAALRVAFPHS